MDMETIFKQTTSFRDDLLTDLKDPEFAMYYLEAALTEHRKMAILKHFGQHCGMSQMHKAG